MKFYSNNYIRCMIFKLFELHFELNKHLEEKRWLYYNIWEITIVLL